MVVVVAVTGALASGPADLPVMDGVPTAEAETVGMSSGRLERIDRVMQAYVDRNETAGVVTLVARRGKVVHFSALGERDAESGAPMTHDSAHVGVADPPEDVVRAELPRGTDPSRPTAPAGLRPWRPDSGSPAAFCPRRRDHARCNSSGYGRFGSSEGTSCRRR